MIAVKVFMVIMTLGIIAWAILIIVGIIIGTPKTEYHIDISPVSVTPDVEPAEVKILPPTELKKEDFCLTKDLVNILL